MASNFTPKCYEWMGHVLRNPNVTLQEINDHLILRFLGGITLLAVLLIIGLIGNAHVIYIYLRKFKNSNYRLYVLWLAMLDILNCCVGAPLVIVYLMYPVTFPSEIFCKIYRFVLYYLAVASTCALVVIAIDRCRKVWKPLGRQITTKQARTMCVVSALISVMFCFPAPILYGNSTVETGIPGLQGTRCLTQDNFKNSKYMVFYQISLIGFFFFVSALLIVVYTLIGKRILQHSNFRMENSLQMSPTKRREVEVSSMISGPSLRRTTKTLFTVTLAYILSALPHHCLAILFFVKPSLDCEMNLLQSQIYYTFIWSYFVNMAINPFIYGFRDKKFRNEIKYMYSSKSQD